MKRSEIEAVLAEHPTAVFSVGTSRYTSANYAVTISGFEQVRKSRYSYTDGSKVTVAVTHHAVAGYREHRAEEYTWVRDPRIEEKGSHERLGQITHVLANSFDEWVDAETERFQAAMVANREQAAANADATAAAQLLTEATVWSVWADGDKVAARLTPAQARALVELFTTPAGAIVAQEES